MAEKFWDSLAGRLADRWAALAPPALAFWLLAVLAWSWGHGGLSAITRRLESLGGYSSVAQGLIVAACLLVAAGSVALVDRLTIMIIPLLGGRWPRWAEPLSDRRSARFRGRQERLAADWGKLSRRVLECDSPAPEDELRFAELDDLLRRFPVPATRIMPTRFGNILRAAETRPQARTGLVTSVVLPRLLVVVPDATRKDLTSAWSAVSATASVIVWSVLLIPFSWWCPAVLVAVPIGAAVTCWWLPGHAEIYADRLESMLDMYRPQLYEKLRWPLPASPRAEPACGRLLSQYLVRGTLDWPISYRDSPGGRDDQ
jgi:hypothetical protein